MPFDADIIKQERINPEHKEHAVKAVDSLERVKGVFPDIGAARELGYTKVLEARSAELPELGIEKCNSCFSVQDRRSVLLLIISSPICY